MTERIVERLVRERDVRCGDGIYTATSPWCKKKISLRALA